MARVKIHHDQVTLPTELRRALSVADEEELDAELVEDGVLLKPSPEARRRAGLADIRAAQAGVRLSPELEALSPEELEEVIAEEVRAHRREAALERIHRAQAGVRYIGPEPRPSPEEEEQLIADLLAAEEAEEAAKRRHD